MIHDRLDSSEFSSYPPEARSFALQNMNVLERLPSIYLPILLAKIISYDWLFPAERVELDQHLTVLGAMSPAKFEQQFKNFAVFGRGPSTLRDSVRTPVQVTEQISAYLWTSGQIEAFRLAAESLQTYITLKSPTRSPRSPRLLLVLFGEGTAESRTPIFEKLAPHGTCFSRMQMDGALPELLNLLTIRSEMYRGPYAHWYIDGGAAAPCGETVSVIGYDSLSKTRELILRKMRATFEADDGGPESLRSSLSSMNPADVGMVCKGILGGEVLERFKLKVLTEGSGTQLFRTTFVQWAARETLRRAQPLTLLLRFTPRSRRQRINNLVSDQTASTEYDEAGSIVDADIGTYYSWLNEQRLQNAEQSSLIALCESRKVAVAVGPAFPRNVVSPSVLGVADLLQMIQVAT